MCDNRIAIIDNGSFLLKGGFSFADEPFKIHPIEDRCSLTIRNNDVYICDTVHGYYRPTSLPIKKGLIHDWRTMEKVWDFVMKRMLDVTQFEISLLMIENPNSSNIQRERIAEYMFEKYNCNSFLIRNQAVLSLYATGYDTGLVFDSGFGISHIVPVYKSYCIPNAIRSLPYGSINTMDVNDFDFLHIKRLINQSIDQIDTDFQKEISSQIILSGGNTVHKGIIEQFENITNLNICTPEDRSISAWVGGSILANSHLFYKASISIDDYNENGLSIINRKCL